MSSRRPHRPSEAEAIAATAAAWLAQRDDGFTPEQAAAFAAWRSADVRHEAAAQRLEAAWSALQQLREYRPAAVRHPDRDVLASVRERRRRPALAGLGRLAAMAAVLTLVLAGWYGWERRERTRFATTIDGYQRVLLADGSVAELNGDTELDVRYSADERRVRLRRGEAHFSVARNSVRPFVVEARGVAVRAVGTAFNVRLDAERVDVLVTQGRVEVAPALPPAGRGEAPVRDVPPRATQLAANERVSVSLPREPGPVSLVAPPVVEKVAPAAIREALAWQGPRLVFTDTPLAEVIAQFNRRNAVQIELARPDMGALPIGGSFRAENVDAFVRLLASGGDIVAERPEPHRIVLRAVP
jgi:transmembrane sensor